MELYKIRVENDPVLRRKCRKVDKVDNKVRDILDRMLETMYAANGIGLAAPQVGLSRRLVVMDLSEKRNEPIKIVNPKVTFLSDEEELGTEGCLSFPGKEGEVWRCTKVRLTGLNEEGQEVEYEAEGLFARCIQHECDHLDGKLYVDVAEDLRPVDRDKAEDTVACAESAQAEGDGVKEEVAPEASVPDKSQAELAE